MNDQPVNTNPNTFYDIAPGGQTMPPTTSRPVIVGNRPEQTDQMVNWQSQQSAQPAGGLVIPDLPAGAQPSADYGVPPPGAAVLPQAAGPTNYAPQSTSYAPQPQAYGPPAGYQNAPQANYVPQPQAYGSPGPAGYENPAPDVSFINNQVVAGNDRSLLKAILWFGLLIFSVVLFIVTLIEWSSL